ncbi:tetratricopeptide repeat protein [bacterium]|nr:tetratricopeptide repeat protein [bacterium]MCB2178946.1 tetratricopeptide repeat protein [bacterium]
MDRQRRQRRTNPVFVVLILGLIGLMWYFNQYVVEDLPIAHAPTPTPTPIPESLELQADQLADEGKLYQAIELYNQTIMVSTGSSNLANLYVKLAHNQILAGEYEAAKTSAENALLLNDGDPRALAELGWAQSFLGNEVEAEKDLQQALALNPDSVEAHAYYAELLTDQGDYEGASVHSKEALQLDNQSLVALRARGYLLYYTANYELAAEQFQQALQINDQVADLHQFLGLAYWSMGEYDLAVESFNNAARYNSDSPMPDTYISRIYVGTGEYAKAAQFARSAVEKDVANPIRWGNWGIALYKNQQFAEAIDAFAYAIRGGETEDGIAIQGMTLDYDTAEYFYMYGLALANARECSTALPIFQSLIANVPTDDVAVANAEAGIQICEQYVSTDNTAGGTAGETTATPEADEGS